MTRLRSVFLVLAAASLAAVISTTSASAVTVDSHAGVAKPAGVWWGDWAK